ncbi:MAG: hypothetical protein WBR13_00460 [Allosphingosinicella sp.]
MTPKPRAKNKPRAKPARGKAATGKQRNAQPARPKRRITKHKLIWQSVTLAVSYEAESFASHAHLELRVLAPEGMPIPVTETGYRSHFLPRGYVEDAGGPVAYVRRWLDREATSQTYRRALARWRQLELFG